MGKSEVQGLFRTIPVIFTFILAGITIVASFSEYYNPINSVYMPVLGLIVPILLLCNLLVMICWTFTCRKWVLLAPLFAFVFNWNYLFAIFQFNFTEKMPQTHAANPTSDGYVKIATYNVQNFGMEITGYSAQKIAAYMQQEQVDILCFQEFDDNPHFSMDSIRQIFGYWEYALMPSKELNQKVLPIAVFSRYPVINDQFISFNESANCSMQCDVVVGNDTIRIINNHLQTTSVSQNRKKWKRELATNDTRREVEAVQGAIATLHTHFLKRAEQTQTICKLAINSPYPVLACGDFNSLPSSYTYRQLNKILKDGFRSSGRGYMYTYRYFKRLLRIDYIFHSPSLKGCRYYSPNLDLCSDHNPVLMEVKIDH